jgi:hypothetical protein
MLQRFLRIIAYYYTSLETRIQVGFGRGKKPGQAENTEDIPDSTG